MEGVEIGSDAEIQWIAHLLEVSPDGLRKVLTSRTTETPRGEKMTTPLTIDQSLDCRYIDNTERFHITSSVKSRFVKLNHKFFPGTPLPKYYTAICSLG